MYSHEACLAVKRELPESTALLRYRGLCYASLCRRDKESGFRGVARNAPLSPACERASVAAFRRFLSAYLRCGAHNSAPESFRESPFRNGINGGILAFRDSSAHSVAHAAEKEIIIGC